MTWFSVLKDVFSLIGVIQTGFAVMLSLAVALNWHSEDDMKATKFIQSRIHGKKEDI